MGCGFHGWKQTTVIPGREFRAKLTKSILSLNERSRNDEQVQPYIGPGNKINGRGTLCRSGGSILEENRIARCE
jgi:hypothetical protein